MIKSCIWTAIGLVLCLSQGYASNESGETPSTSQDMAPQNIVSIPAGVFVMGCQPGRDTNCFRTEKSAHTVTMPSFKMMTHEVTFEQWDRCVELGKCYRPDDDGWGRGQRPVINVSWHDIQVYIQWLKEYTGKEFRLPSEAEWEYAARAGGDGNYEWGNDIGKGRANCDGCGSKWDDQQTAPVGSFAPNAFGLYDMHGNVSEWVQDRWHGNYRGAPSDGSVWEAGGSPRRVLRGGSWYHFPQFLRSAYRRGSRADFRRSGSSSDRGFRLVPTL